MVVSRQNAMLTSGVGLFQMTIAALIDKQAGESLKQTVEGLTDD